MLGFLKKKNKAVELPLDKVGCLGKFPVHVEFIRLGINDLFFQEMDLWQQQAYNLLHQSFNKSQAMDLFTKSPSYCFLIRDMTSQSAIIGRLIPSEDKSGRNYPLTLFRRLLSTVAHEFHSIIPVLYQDYFIKTDEILSESQHGQALDEFLKTIKDSNKYSNDITRRKALEVVVNNLKDITFKSYWQDLQLHLPELSLDKFIAALTNILGEIKNNNPISPLIIRLPLANNLIYLSTVFWLELITTVLPSVNNFTVLWHKANDFYPASMLFVNQKILPAHYPIVVQPDSPHDQVLDLFKELNNENLNSSQINEENVLSSSLFEVLQQWSKLV